ncbi:MAG: ribose ABC transporter permease [Spirochaetes bacterium RBG_16_67_19]|nr:MAG: ribose ABC transporter permease [Spirochaetes bacterium GWB1_59_5]OHD74574.1 MAG: ribose ABC transporter permease [Spirochaetes bacterium RBG_16_67_19]
MPNVATAGRSGIKERLLPLLRFREGGVLLALILLCLLLTLGTDKFLTPYNLGIVVRQIAFVATIALGQTLVLLTGGIDLSVGTLAGLCSIIGSLLMVSTKLDPYLCALLATLLGAGLGGLNGVLISYLKMNPFIVTLAAGEVFAGLVLVVTRGYPVTGIPESYRVLGQGMLGFVPVPAIAMLVIALVLTFVLNRMPYGRSIYALGGNESAARLAGIDVKKVKFSVYLLSGFLAAFVGMMFVSRMNAGQPTIGPSWLLPSITAAILGGTSLSGGEGTMIGTIIGATLMGVLANGIVLMNISPYWERVIIGAVVIAAVLIDRFREKKA